MSLHFTSLGSICEALAKNGIAAWVRFNKSQESHLAGPVVLFEHVP